MRLRDIMLKSTASRVAHLHVCFGDNTEDEKSCSDGIVLKLPATLNRERAFGRTI